MAEEEDYYATLDVPRTATPDEIKRAYNAKARKTHPDKIREGGTSATTNMAKLNEAKDVLCDETKRKLYDKYGAVGLTMLDFRGKKTPQEILAELERKNQELMARDIRLQSGSEGHVTMTFDATRSWNSDRVQRFNWPSFAGLRISETLECRPTAHSKLSFTGSVSPQVMQPGMRVMNNLGSFRMSYHQKFSGSTKTRVYVGREANSWCYGGEISGMMMKKTLGRVGFAHSALGGQINFRAIREFSPTMSGAVMCSIGANSKCEARLVNQTYSVPLHMTLFMTPVNLGVQVGAEKKVADGTVASASLVYSAQDVFLDAGVTISVLEYSEIALKAQVGLNGTAIVFSYRRLGHALDIPIVLSHDWIPRLALAAILFPFSVYGVGRFLVNRICPPNEEIERDLEVCMAKYREYEREVKNLREEAREKIAREPTGGLVITKARYGNFAASEEDQEKYHLVIDVTIPLQALMSYQGPRTNSKILLLTSKKKLRGFYDTDPGQTKHLEVWYSLGGHPHYVKVEDSAELKMPLKAHRMT